MVRPIIEFASPVWDPYTALHVNKIKNIQRSAVRFCFNNYSWTNSVTTMLNKLNLVLLKDRRFHSKSIMMYLIVVTWARGICLICMPKARGPQARGLRAYIHIRQITSAHVTTIM